MKNSSVRNKQRIFNPDQYTIIQQINRDKTVFIVESSKTEKKSLMKIIELGQSNMNKENQRLIRMINTNHSNLLKPDWYCFKMDQKTKTSTLYLLSPRYPVSLEKIIADYRRKQKMVPKSFLQKFIISMYNLVSKLNDPNNLQSGNLKPSNIFYINEEWYVSQFGIPSCRISKYYAKGHDIVYGKSRALQYWHSCDKIGSDNDLYSLGMIIIEMMTLSKIQKVNKMLKQYKSQHQEETQKAISNYSIQMFDFAKCLIFGPKSAKAVFKRFKDTIKNEYNSSESYDFGDLQNITYKGVKQLDIYKQKIRDLNYDCSKLFNIFKKYDPDLDFILTKLNAFQQLSIREFNYQNQENIINIQMYYNTVSQMRYVNLLKDVCSCQDIMSNLIMLAIQEGSFSDEKQFYTTQTSGRDNWSAENIVGFFQTLDVEMSLEQVQTVIRQFTKDPKRNYLTYKDVKALVGKQNLMQSKILQEKKKHKALKQIVSKEEIYQSQLLQMLSLLSKANDGNLFRFFRDHDPKSRWVNEYVIQRIMKESIRMSDEKFKRATELMWRTAGTPAQNKQDRKLKYIVLLKQTKQYQPQKLFKMVLTEMCNQSNFKSVFKEYKVSGKNVWNEKSLLDLNQNQMLQFHEREIRLVFRDLDADGSKQITSQQLIFKLTGLNEYNQSAYIELLRQAKQQKNMNVIKQFMKNDGNSDLDLDSIPELINSFKGLDIEISKQHAQKLYYNYEYKDQFMYLKFLRHLYTVTDLFKESVLFILKEHYKSDFERLYKMGLHGKAQKWTIKSINEINEEVVLGFTEKQLQEVWQNFDKNGDISLSKAEVATIFGFNYDKQFNSSQFIENYDDDQKIQNMKGSKDDPKLSKKQSKKKIQKDKTFKDRLEQQIQKNQTLYNLRQKSKKRNILQFFIEADKEHKMALSLAQFEQVLTTLGIMYKLKTLKENLKDFLFQFKDDKYVNYIQIMMFFSSLENNQAESKAQTLATIINTYLKYNQITVEQMLKNPRQKNRWSLNAMEKWAKQSLICEIYFDDLEIVWNYWGGPTYMDAKQLKEILSNQGKFYNSHPKINVISDHEDSQSQRETRQQKYQKQFKKANLRARYNKEEQSQQDRYIKKQQKYSKQKMSTLTPPRQFKDDPIQKNNDKPPRPPKPTMKQLRFQQLKTQNFNDSTPTSIFIKQINKYGLGKIQNISKNNYIDTKDFKRCLIMHYGLDQDQIQNELKKLQKNNRIKLSDLKLFIQVQAQTSQQVQSRMQPSSSQIQTQNQNSISLPYKNTPSRQKQIKNQGLVKQNIRLLLNAFSNKRDLSQLDKWIFKDNEYISLDIFIKKWKDVTEAVTSNSLEDIFNSMNPIQNLISLIAFKIAFYRQNQQSQQVQFPPQIQKQLSHIFAKSDTNSNKKIQRNQLAGLLSTIGINFNAKDIQLHFKSMDMDGQNSIDFNQFKNYIQKNVFKHIGNFQQHVDQIQQILQDSDILGVGYLNADEFKQATNRMKVNLTNNEIVNLFTTVSDQGKVQIKKLISMLYDVEKIKNQKTRMALYKIRFGKKLTLKDIKGVFSKLSTGYTGSYSWNVMKSKQLLPSSSMRPKLDHSGLFFKDYLYTNMTNITPNTLCLQRVEKYNQLSLFIRLDEATGVPIPLQNNLNRNNIVRRYLSISFLDTIDQKLKNSICEIDAVWDPDNEDIWSFNNDLGFEKDILVKIGDYNPQLFDQTVVMFEFNMSYVQNGSGIQISCGSASLPIKEISRLTSVTDKKLQIQGGIPTKRKYFKKQDINARRTVWKKLFSYGEIESILKVEVLPSSKFRDKLKHIEVLPLRIICCNSCIDIFYCFRQYFAEHSVQKSKIVPMYVNDNRIQTFLYSIDCRNIYCELIPFWNNTIVYKFGDNIGVLKKWLQTILDELFLLLVNKDFGFLPGYPTYSSLQDKTLHNTRNKLVKEAFENILALTKNQKKKYKIQASTYRQLKHFDQQDIKEDNILKSLKVKNR